MGGHVRKIFAYRGKIAGPTVDMVLKKYRGSWEKAFDAMFKTSEVYNKIAK